MKKQFCLSGVFGVLFIVLIALVKTVDVAAVGPEGTSIGFSTLNVAFHNLTGVNMVLYDLTDILGYVSILAGLLWCFVGFIQFVKRRSLMKVDKELLATIGLYGILFGLYIVFEIVIINYRPIIIPGDAHVEASFPSSHTMLTCVIMGSIILLAGRYLVGKVLKNSVICASAALAVIVVAGRLLSGVHWFTDILGGLLISACLVFLFSGVLKLLEKKD